MRLIIITLCLLANIITATAQVNYDANLVPKNLLPYASAIVRNEEITIEVKAYDNAVYHVKKAITILNKNGDDMARVVVWYNKNNVIKNIKGLVFNEFGKQVSKFSESNFEDVNAGNDFSLFEDSRIKHFLPAVTSYPYTIEYEYEVKSKQTLTFNDWKPTAHPGVAIEKSSFTFICKPDFNIRYKETNLSGKVTVSTTKDGLKSYLWKVADLKALRDEPYSPNPDVYLGSVKIAPENFIYNNISGSFTNWTDLGKWVYDKLLFNRDKLSEATIAHIKQLTANITDTKEKARKIYEYMQQKTHYISVQVGIGGFQPFLAGDVDNLNYGDCKALVNYTQALLKTVGINSWYCVVEAGTEKLSLLDDFASMNQGNHVILCIPFKNDTTWLECTNQKIPFGFLGAFTDNRTVLACTAQGGKLLHTPHYKAQNNLQTCKANFTIAADGELSGNMETYFRGTQYDNRESLINKSATEQVKGFKSLYPINNLDIEQFSLKQDKNIQPVTTENIKLIARDYASVNNSKMYFLINPVNRTNRAPREIRNRLNTVYINDGYTDEDEVSYILPKGYRLEKTPLNISVNKPFGSYVATLALNGEKLVYKRKIQLIDGNYSKDTYEDLVDFYKTVSEADNYSVTLTKAIN